MRLSMRGLGLLEIFIRTGIYKIPFSTKAGAAASQRGYPSKAGVQPIRGPRGTRPLSVVKATVTQPTPTTTQRGDGMHNHAGSCIPSNSYPHARTLTHCARLARVPCPVSPVIVRPFARLARVYICRAEQKKYLSANPYGIRLTADTCTLQSNNMQQSTTTPEKYDRK
jgi:hypothetical protein